MNLAALDALTASSVFADLPAGELAGLAGLAREERFTHATQLAARGDRPASLWCVLQGGVEIGLFSQAGRSAQLAPIAEGGWATWLACFHDAPLPHDLWTRPDTRLLAFPAAAVRGLAVAYPTLYPRVIERIGARMRDLIGGNLAASLHRPEGRLAYLLAVSARDRAGQGDGPVELPLTQERLAAMGLGGRQRVARLLRALAGRGLVECCYGRVRIPSLRALEAFALP